MNFRIYRPLWDQNYPRFEPAKYMTRYIGKTLGVSTELFVGTSYDEMIDQASLLATRFAHVTPLAHIARYRNGATIDEYAVYSVEGLKAAPFSVP